MAADENLGFAKGKLAAAQEIAISRPRMKEAAMINRVMLEEVIDSAGAVFDSHAIIREVTQKNQREYIIQLYDERDRVGPVHYVHSQLGREITEICTERGYTRKAVRNRDIFGQRSKCIQWEKHT